MGKTKEELEEEEARNIEIWKIKQLIKKLEKARGNGTSMISLILPPKDQITRVSKMLGDEYGTASHIKSRVNRLSVLGAITATQQRLKLYSKVPPNGLVIYCGTIMTDDNKTKKITIDLQPFRKINTSLYLCDNKFHVKPLLALLETSDRYGFIVMDGNGTLYGTLCGDTREVIHKFGVDLPKKHGRGGQSAQRFGRIRMEKRHHYIRKVAEFAQKLFLKNEKPNIAGIVLAGSADFKTVLGQSDMFDQRLGKIILNTVDVAYGGESGFKEAIRLSEDVLANVKFVREKKLIKSFMDHIAKDTGKFVFGVKETMAALEAGAIKTLICWENLDITKYEFKNPVTKETNTICLTPKQETDSKHFHDKKNGVKLEYKSEPLLDYLAENYRNFGCSLEFVSNKSQEGSQFCRGFGGVGGILRYQMDFSLDYEEEADNFDSDDEELDYHGDDLDGFM